MENKPALTIQTLSIAYGKTMVLHNVSFDLFNGEVLAVIGPNGAGKSTLIRGLSGMIAPNTGSIATQGLEIHRLPPEERARRVAVVPQAVRLPDGYTVLDTVLMGRTPYLGWFARETETDRQIARQALTQTGTLEFANRWMNELSGGEQQRVLIARALAQAAPILLMDEPTSHLDLKHQSAILTLTRSLAASGLAVLVVLHDLNLAARFSDRVALIVDGALNAIGRPADVLTDRRLSTAYEMPVNVMRHPALGTPLILPN